MILKIASDRVPGDQAVQWLYLDHLARVMNMGPVVTRQHDLASNPDHHPDGGLAPYYFGDVPTLRRAVEQHWGLSGNGINVEDAFATVVWPNGLDLDRPTVVHAIFAEREDSTCVLALVTDEAYLMSDDGKTIDRLR